MWREKDKSCVKNEQTHTRKRKGLKIEGGKLGSEGKKIINSQGIWNRARGCGGVKGQNIPSAARVGLEQQSCVARKHLGPLRGERICVPALDWHSICPVKGAHPANTLRAALPHLWSKLRRWSYLLMPPFRGFTTKHTSVTEEGNLFGLWQWTRLCLIWLFSSLWRRQVGRCRWEWTKVSTWIELEAQ